MMQLSNTFFNFEQIPRRERNHTNHISEHVLYLTSNRRENYTNLNFVSKYLRPMDVKNLLLIFNKCWYLFAFSLTFVYSCEKNMFSFRLKVVFLTIKSVQFKAYCKILFSTIFFREVLGAFAFAFEERKCPFSQDNSPCYPLSLSESVYSSSMVFEFMIVIGNLFSFRIPFPLNI